MRKRRNTQNTKQNLPLFVINLVIFGNSIELDYIYRIPSQKDLSLICYPSISETLIE